MGAIITLAGFEFADPVVMNAGGGCRTIEHVRALAASDTDVINLGPITAEERTGNEGCVFYPGQKGLYYLNSIGLKNPGMPFYRQLIPQMAKIAGDAGKPLI